MKLALDPQMFFATSRCTSCRIIVARLGYDWMELSPKADFVPFFQYPRIDDAGVRKLKKVAADAGVGIASVLPVQRWSGPDEDQRQAAVRAWKRAIQITVDLGVDVMNSEFNGRPEAAEHAEAMFLKSMDELLPIFEREGVQLILEPHPDDFIEDGHRGGGAAPRAQPGLDRLLVLHPARVPPGPRRRRDHRARPPRRCATCTSPTRGTTLTSNGLRYITNPPGNTARVHQHMEMGRGEVDYDAVFAALASVGFDGVISSCVFGWEEDARRRQRPSAGEGPGPDRQALRLTRHGVISTRSRRSVTRIVQNATQ